MGFFLSKLGILLAIILFPAVDAFALPLCNASAPYCTNVDCNSPPCQCCQSSTVASINSIPTTIYSSVGNQAPCTGIPQLVTTLPFTDESSTHQHTLPPPAALGYTYIYTNPAPACPGGETCLVSGTCCASLGCASSSSIACGVQYNDNCGNPCGQGTFCGANENCSDGSCMCAYTNCGENCCSSTQTVCNGSLCTAGACTLVTNTRFFVNKWNWPFVSSGYGWSTSPDQGTLFAASYMCQQFGYNYLIDVHRSEVTYNTLSGSGHELQGSFLSVDTANPYPSIGVTPLNSVNFSSPRLWSVFQGTGNSAPGIDALVCSNDTSCALPALPVSDVCPNGMRCPLGSRCQQFLFFYICV